MGSERLTLPQQKVWEYAHGLAYTLAREQLANIKDIQEQCRKSGAQYLSSQKAVAIAYLNQNYRISLPGGEVSFAAGDEAVPARDKILILHYFLQARGTPPAGRLITYQELPDGINYFPVFAKRAIKPVVSNFGGRPEQLLEAAAALGGKKANYGDAAVTISAFSHVPVTFALWRGDDEFPPQGSIMFDGNIADYLTNDDIHALCETITWKLVKSLKAGGDNPGNR